jgi:hypothetical protein
MPRGLSLRTLSTMAGPMILVSQMLIFSAMTVRLALS